MNPIEKAARKLFAALDHVDPTWRNLTLCRVDGDEVNDAWCELSEALAWVDSHPNFSGMNQS